MLYTEVGSFEAKAKLSQLIQEVKRGRRYTITLRGKPIADLVPSGSATHQDARLSVENMRGIEKIQGISAETITEWIVEGRK